MYHEHGAEHGKYMCLGSELMHKVAGLGMEPHPLRLGDKWGCLVVAITCLTHQRQITPNSRVG